MSEEEQSSQKLSVAEEIDPVEAFFLGRPLPPPPSPTAGHERTIAGLRALAQDYAWGGVLELATSILNDDDDAAEVVSATASAVTISAIDKPDDVVTPPSLLLPHERLMCEAYRCLALVQTSMIERASAILQDLGPIGPGNPKYRYESFPDQYPDHAPGSFIPFELSAVSIDVRVREGDASAIADCYALKRHFPEHNLYITSTLIGYHLRAQQFDTAVDLCYELVRLQGSTARALYLYGRILLHVGDLDEALRVFAIADTRSDASDELRHLHRGMALSSRGEHARALAENDLAIRALEKAPDASRRVRVFAECNGAICMMHLGRLSEGITRIEGFLRSDPQTALDEGVVFNLATMYDLAFPDIAMEKKQTVRKLASRYGRQGFNFEF